MAPKRPLRRLIMARARLLDLTRSLRRADRGATGVDRVERAYLQRFLEEDTPAFGLVRTPLGYLLLDRAGLTAFQDRLQGKTPWGAKTILSRLGRNRSATIRQAESDLRGLACARAIPARLRSMLARHLDDGFDYFNVGHSNLTNRVFDAVKATNGQAHVLIHDVIPLSHPQFQRTGSPQRFRDKLRRVSTHADRVIYNSADTRQQAETHLQKLGRVPPAIVSHLGTMPPQPDPTTLPDDLPPRSPYFVTVGTIEPRKNHGFLLDLWAQMGTNAPRLMICGARGWQNEDLFSRLNALPPDSPVTEHANLSDAALAHLVQQSAGVLFPSHVEGFGLPPLEALTLGARVLCNDLPVLREFLHDKPVYAAVSDQYSWLTTIKKWEANPPGDQNPVIFSGPTWDDHFKVVLRLT